MNDQVTNIVHHGAVNACSGEVWVALSTWCIGFSTKQTLQGVGIREEEQEMLGRGVHGGDYNMDNWPFCCGWIRFSRHLFTSQLHKNVKYISLLQPFDSLHNKLESSTFLK